MTINQFNLIYRIYSRISRPRISRMEKISEKNCSKLKKKTLGDLNETMRVYCPNKEKKVISRTQFYDPRISRIYKIMSKICPKFVQNFSTYTWVYTVFGLWECRLISIHYKLSAKRIKRVVIFGCPTIRQRNNSQ